MRVQFTLYSAAEIFNSYRDHRSVKVALSPEQIHKIAHLAKLSIDEDSIAEISGQLDNIMTLIDHMQQADTTGVAPLSHPQDPVLRLREDKVTDTDRRDDFMRLTPHSEDGLYLVPRVIE